uniref:Ig-like domain-containing protein n=1 Tax=Anabas testudineus TaxID=64144 RepID=A0A3Q1JTZ7_ANATE
MVRLDLLVYFTVSCSLVSGLSLYYGLKGLKVNLKPNVTGVLDEILWKHNNNKVIEFDGKQDHVYGLFKNRVTLDRVSAELNISDLRYEDSGEYTAETYTIKAFDRKTYKLEVIDKVAKPTISCQRDDGSFSTTHGNQATLSCSAESRQPQHLQYEWISHGTVRPGQKLTITLSDDNEEYSCRVNNPLTSETTTFTAKDCFQTDSDESSSIAWIAVLISAVIFVVVVTGIFCWNVGPIITVSRKTCFIKGNRDDVEKQLQQDTTQGSNKRGAQNEEDDPLLHRDANCHPEDKVSCTRKGLDKPSSAEGLNKVPGINKEDADADQHKEPDSSASEKTPQPEPVPDGSNKEKPQNEENVSPPHRAPNVSSGQQLVNLPQSNENMNPNDSDRNHTEDT